MKISCWSPECELHKRSRPREAAGNEDEVEDNADDAPELALRDRLPLGCSAAACPIDLIVSSMPIPLLRLLALADCDRADRAMSMLSATLTPSEMAIQVQMSQQHKVTNASKMYNRYR